MKLYTWVDFVTAPPLWVFGPLVLVVLAKHGIIHPAFCLSVFVGLIVIMATYRG